MAPPVGAVPEGLTSATWATHLQDDLMPFWTMAEAKGTPIVFASGNFYVDADKDGKADRYDKNATIRYNAFTPKLMKAGFNYRYVHNDPGAFVHNPKYVMQFLIDSIEDLGGDVKAFNRPEVAKK